jgi:AmiR/NasT family two-component response regulator
MFTDPPILTAIIAEDDFLVALGVVQAAEAAGLTVIGTAADGVEAVELVTRLSPSVALVDIEMPRLDGVAAAARIRDEHPTPVVMLSAYDSAELVAAATGAGAGAYITKPPEAAALRRAVDIAMARHGDLVALRRVNAELLEARRRIGALENLLPVCAQCKRMRNDSGVWQPIESRLSEHAGAASRHRLCPDCMLAPVRSS